MKKVSTLLALILIWLMPVGPLVAVDSVANLRKRICSLGGTNSLNWARLLH